MSKHEKPRTIARDIKRAGAVALTSVALLPTTTALANNGGTPAERTSAPAVETTKSLTTEQKKLNTEGQQKANRLAQSIMEIIKSRPDSTEISYEPDARGGNVAIISAHVSETTQSANGGDGEANIELGIVAPSSEKGSFDLNDVISVTATGPEASISIGRNPRSGYLETSEMDANATHARVRAVQPLAEGVLPMTADSLNDIYQRAEGILAPLTMPEQGNSPDLSINGGSATSGDTINSGGTVGSL